LVDAKEALGKSKRDASMSLLSAFTQKERAAISLEEVGVASDHILINKQQVQAYRVALCFSFNQNMPRAPHVATVLGPQTPEGKFWDPRTDNR
jgi:hypothetical protein